MIMEVVLERETREIVKMVVFAPGNLINGGIYHRVRNGELRPMMVSNV